MANESKLSFTLPQMEAVLEVLRDRKSFIDWPEQRVRDFKAARVKVEARVRNFLAAKQRLDK